MTAILGISAFYHDSAAALVVDGEIVAAAQEERFSRRKHDAEFPAAAVRYCLAAAGITPGDLDYVAFYEKPLLTFDRLLETYLAFAPRGFFSFAKAMPLWLGKKLRLPREMDRHLRPGYRRRYIFAEHHQSHAASAFFPSPFERAAVLTVDGVGEWATATCGVGEGNRITLSQQLRFPHSLGLLYSAFTTYCGFQVNSGEYKLMGLAPYGEPRFEGLIRERLLDLKDDGSFRLDLSYFNYAHGLTMTSRKFHRLFGGPPRRPESELTEREMDLAASIQRVTEDVLLRMVQHLHRQTGSSLKHLCLAGGVALNSVANGRILCEGPFEDVWIQPAAGDAGGALGSALLVWHQLLGNPRRCDGGDRQRGSFLGPAYSEDEVRAVLDRCGARYRFIPDEDRLCEETAELLAAGRIVAWAQGRMEYGPRALGHRSILGDARVQSLQLVINRRVKERESFRPFAPSVLRERADEFFELDIAAGRESPYMQFVTAVRADKRTPLSAGDETLRGLNKLRPRRSVIPAVMHVDGSARVQTVDAARHGRYHRLLRAFERRTGMPVLINTSFNVRGEPIVCTPEDAWQCFMATGIDALVIERFLLLKDEQPPTAAHSRTFAPD